uniref:Uncharacterized protein n=1 Tax=Romanomermis culicivorax TaxID=13658 RepID=A0A915K6K8_ROMCU
PILTSKLETTVPISDDTSLITLDISANIVLLEKILDESHLSNIDFPVTGETPLLTGCGLAAYLSYLCSTTEHKCIAVHPNFSGNSYVDSIMGQEMQASNFLLNPRAHLMQSIEVVLIPILLQGQESMSYADLQRSVGHWKGIAPISMLSQVVMPKIVDILFACMLKQTFSVISDLT